MSAPGFKGSFFPYASITVDALPSALHNHQHHILRDGKYGSVDRESKGKDARRPLQDDSVGSVKEDSLNTSNVNALPTFGSTLSVRGVHSRAPSGRA